MKLGKYCILCTDQKNLQSKSIKVWLALYKIKMETIFMNTENNKTS